jgi:hypothetical protein
MSQLGSDQIPPTNSEFTIPVEAPGWPKVLGIFSIVWAGLGIPCSLCISIMSMVGGAFYEWGRQKQIEGKMPDPGPMPAVYQPTILEALCAMVWFVGVVVLLVAGIQTVRRRAAGRTTHLAYAAISIIGSLAYAVVAVMKAFAIKEWISHNAGDPYLKQPGASFAANPITAIISTLVLLVFPVFVVIWFGALGKRPEIGAPLEEPLV